MHCTVKNSNFLGKKISRLGKFGKNFPNIPRFSPLFSMVCNFGAALTSFVFAGFPTFPKMGIPTQNGIYFPKWENLGIFGKTWFPVLGFFGKIWENNFLEVNLWWEILGFFGKSLFPLLGFSLRSCFGKFWEITGKISRTGKIFPGLWTKWEIY